MEEESFFNQMAGSADQIRLFFHAGAIEFGSVVLPPGFALGIAALQLGLSSS